MLPGVQDEGWYLKVLSCPGVIVVINEVGVGGRTSQRVVIMAIGSRGDVVPMVNLARGVDWFIDGNYA